MSYVNLRKDTEGRLGDTTREREGVDVSFATIEEERSPFIPQGVVKKKGDPVSMGGGVISLWFF